MTHRALFRLASCSCLLGVLGVGSAISTAWADEAAGKDAGEDAAALVGHCRELAGISKGVCSVLGCGDAAVPLALARSGGFFIHVQDPRPVVVAAARKATDADGLYGKHVVVEQGDLARLPYANCMIDLILAVDLTASELEEVSLPEILRVLRPGGRAILGRRKQPADDPERLTAGRLRAWLEQARIERSSVVEDRFGVWAQVIGPPLDGVDSWSHWEHGPDNNPVSTDTVIRAPYMTRWLGRPLYIAMPAVTTSAGGRLFMAMGHIAHHRREEAWLNTLLARNGYNGTILWKRKLPDGYLAHRSAFIATDDTFYMIDPERPGCLLLDPETGEEREGIFIAELGGNVWKWMALKDGVLYALAGNKKGPAETMIVRSPHTHWSWGELSRGYYKRRVPWGFGTTILAYDLDRRETLWIHREEAAIDSRAMVVGGDRVFFYGPDSRLGCLDASTGELVWANDDPEVRQLIEAPGRGLSSTPGFRSTCFSLYTPKALFFQAQTRMNLVAVSTEDGRLLWQRRKSTNNPNMIYVDDRLYVGLGRDGSTLALDPATGRTLEDLGFKKRSCVRLTAAPDSFFCRGWPEGLTRYDRKTGQVLFNGAFRPSCNDGVIPAGGLLYFGPWACDCNLSVMGRVALGSAADFKPHPLAAQTRRLETGAGDISRVEPLDISQQDWPTYRADTSRSAASSASVSGPLSRIWQFRPRTENRPTAPTAAGGLVFLGGDDGKVRALDAATGNVKWTFLTAGPVLQPPTIDNGRAYVGSGDGHVYAIEARTGRLLWRFRVAPADRRIMVYGTLCSTWPVHSGVLVQDGVAYAAAGIVDYDGTYVCALGAATGQPKWINDSSGHLDPALRKGVSAQGTLTIADGRLWMAGGNVISPAAFDLETGRYLSGPPGDGSPRTNRGEEVALLKDHYLVQGGRLRYSSVRNVVNPGKFVARAIRPGAELGATLPINTGKIAPAWDDQTLVLVDGKGQPPECYSAEVVHQYLKAGDPRRRPKRLWIARALRGSDTISVAVARDAVLAVCATPKFRDWRFTWRLCALDREDGSLTSQQSLPSEALPGGLLVERDGRVVVVMQDGSVACFGGTKALAAMVKSVADRGRREPAERADAVRVLRRALEAARAPEARELVRTSLEELGFHVGDQAAENGYVSRWHVIGDVPWDDAGNSVDRVFVGEPDVDVSKPCRIGDRTLRWHAYATDDAHGKVGLVEIFGPDANVAAYGYAEVTLPEAREVILSVGSNDGFKCWFNGREAGRFDGGRSYVPDQDRLHVKAKKGVNKILIKVTQMGAGWAFSVRLTDPSGGPIDLTRTDR